MCGYYSSINNQPASLLQVFSEMDDSCEAARPYLRSFPLRKLNAIHDFDISIMLKFAVGCLNLVRISASLRVVATVVVSGVEPLEARRWFYLPAASHTISHAQPQTTITLFQFEIPVLILTRTRIKASISYTKQQQRNRAIGR